MLFNSKELNDIIKKNPELPLFFITDNYNIGEGSYTVANEMHIRVGQVSKQAFEDQYYADPDDLYEAIEDSINSNSDYDQLSESEIEDKINEEFNKYEWTEAIIVALS